VTHPSPLSIAWYNNIVRALLIESARYATAPYIGPLFVRTLAFRRVAIAGMRFGNAI
jgi:hypothetical protein